MEHQPSGAKGQRFESSRAYHSSPVNQQLTAYDPLSEAARNALKGTVSADSDSQLTSKSKGSGLTPQDRASELLRKRADVLLRQSRKEITPEQAFAEIERDTAIEFSLLEDQRNTLRTLLQSLLITIHKDQRVIESYATQKTLMDKYRVATDDAVDIVVGLRDGVPK